MGVYINMEMPTAPVLFCIHPDGKVFADLEGGWREYKAIPVPPHGDLIDRDALAEDGWVLTKQVMRMGGHAIHELPLKNPTIPVIIPAEEGET